MRRLLAWVLIVGSLASLGHVLYAAIGPTSGTGRVASQVRWLDGAVQRGKAAHMQDLFPEGEFFTDTLAALAAAQTAPGAQGQRRKELTAEFARLSQAALGPALAQPFGTQTPLPHGVFYHGWRLLVVVEKARLSGADADRAAVRTEAEALKAGFDAAPAGLLSSYPNGYWPCDNVVGVAALHRADALVGVPGAADTVSSWAARLASLRAPGTGLLPHQTQGDGTALDGPRATSQTIIQTFWPEVDPASAARDYARYRQAFVVGKLGLVGLREYPDDRSSAGDIDSGPLVAGVSASASAVALAAARANGDVRLARTLDREAELLGLGLTLPGGRRYALGQLPVGDAFLAWARSVPATAPTSLPSPPGPWWALFAALAALPGLAGVVLLRRRRRTPSGYVSSTSSETGAG